MRRALLAGVVGMMAWAGSAAGQTVVTINGTPMQARVILFDSRLSPNPGPGVELKWDAAKQRYEGDGNGMTYRISYDNWNEVWEVRAVVPEGNFALVSDRRSNLGSVPLRWGGYVGAGPLFKYYPVDDGTDTGTTRPLTEFDDKHLEIEVINP